MTYNVLKIWHYLWLTFKSQVCPSLGFRRHCLVETLLQTNWFEFSPGVDGSRWLGLFYFRCWVEADAARQFRTGTLSASSTFSSRCCCYCLDIYKYVCVCVCVCVCARACVCSFCCCCFFIFFCFDLFIFFIYSSFFLFLLFYFFFFWFSILWTDRKHRAILDRFQVCNEIQFPNERKTDGQTGRTREKSDSIYIYTHSNEIKISKETTTGKERKKEKKNYNKDRLNWIDLIGTNLGPVNSGCVFVLDVVVVVFFGSDGIQCNSMFLLLVNWAGFISVGRHFLFESTEVVR